MLCLLWDCAITPDRIWRRGTLRMSRPAIDFIFMFTRADETVQDCLAVLDTAVRAGVKHMGFKDIGVSFETLVELNRRIKEAGAASYLELVSNNPKACLQSAHAARRLGVDCVMGGTAAGAILAILDDSGIPYLPFPGPPIRLEEQTPELT